MGLGMHGVPVEVTNDLKLTHNYELKKNWIVTGVHRVKYLDIALELLSIQTFTHVGRLRGHEVAYTKRNWTIPK